MTLLLMLTFLPADFCRKKAAVKYQVPPSVKNITKENTYPNSTQDLPTLEPSDLTKKLIDSSKEKIENPDLIRMLNESSINSTPFALGYRAIVYLGQWPLNYESTETSPNWEYQKINTNYYDNRGGKVPISDQVCPGSSENCPRRANSQNR